ncbi:MAG: RagB/SusD family nutrient uptake outer membrane protein [Gemmatimonadota bacterium]|nr:RagB/SusD family nutrient uptake outer membrane protein [Gemmatimonadota bacterium]
MNHKRVGRGRWPLLRPLLGTVLALPLVGCDLDTVLEVQDPDVAGTGQVEQVTALPSVFGGVVGQFQLAYSGSAFTEGQILTSGLLADEYVHSGTFPTRSEVDRRRIGVENATTQGVFRNLHRARRSAEAAEPLFVQNAPNDPRRSEVLSLGGYTYIFFGENYCSGVPFSQFVSATQQEFGPPQTTEQMLNTALQRFDRALQVATAANDTGTINLARIGRGRALLNLGRYEEAAAAVRDVPTDYAYFILHSANSTAQTNGEWSFVNSQERWSVAEREGGNGLNYRSANDPRVQWAPDPGDGRGFDRSTPQFYQFKYPDRAAPVPLADGNEARLIEAEVAMRNGNIAGSIQILNALRARAGVSATTGQPLLPALSATGLTQNQGIDLVFRERAFWMWQTSHRLGDLRRLARTRLGGYGRGTEAVFPTGAYFKGGTYGSDVNLPVSVDELNNPEFRQCIDRLP